MDKKKQAKKQADLIRSKTTELWKAVEIERFERASELRDEIKDLQSRFIHYLANVFDVV
jgi:protein-arginine kinase activator protein McsA